MKLETDLVVEAPASDAWHVIGENFGAIHEWSATLASSSLSGELGVGAVRTCEGVGFGPFPPGEVSEELTHFDPETMSFAYVAGEGLPWFVHRAQNAWSVHAISPTQCRVRSQATVDLVWWLRPFGFVMPWLVRADMAKLAEELKHQIELGRAHPRKVAAAVRSS